MSCLIHCLYCFYIRVLIFLSMCYTVLYCIDVHLLHLNKDYLLTYVLSHFIIQVWFFTSEHG